MINIKHYKLMNYSTTSYKYYFTLVLYKLKLEAFICKLAREMISTNRREELFFGDDEEQPAASDEEEHFGDR